jgi:hypothetical protein
MDAEDPSPSLPPQIPTRPILPVVLALVGGLVLLALVIGWLMRSPQAPPPPAAEARPPADAPAAPPPPAAPALADAPPPPPPPPARGEKSGRAPASDLRSTYSGGMPDVAGPKVISAKRDPACDDPCRGQETPELLGAMGARAGQARSCYERGLANNAGLSGKMQVSVRVSPSGVACSAAVTKDELDDARVSSCVLSRFRSGKYPLPTGGGCVNVSVPINFMPAGSR